MISYTSFSFFIIYFGITFVIYAVVPKKYRWIILLLGSWCFYFLSSHGHILPLLISTGAIWAAGLGLQALQERFQQKRKVLDKSQRKTLKKQYNRYKGATAAFGILVSLGILLVCKYTNFFIGTSNSLFGTAWHEISLVQPLGISFYTLQAISYLADVKGNKVKAEKNPLKLSLYLSFMLTVVEGPIARYPQLGQELTEGKDITLQNMLSGAWRVAWGLLKKAVIADRLAELVNAVFDTDNSYSGTIVSVAVIAYTLQLYFEFSGVMDVVCGLGEMMSIAVPENFNRPFFARSINEFWQRWHISLGAWLRDYIFYPVSLSAPFKKLTKAARKRRIPYYANLLPTAAALFFVWFANGFWHGAGWKYILYGLYYYLFMMAAQFAEPLFDRLCKGLKLDRSSKGFRLFQTVRTFLIVNGGMLLFRAASVSQALTLLQRMMTSCRPADLLPNHTISDLGMDAFDLVIAAAGTALVFVNSLLQEKGIDLRKKCCRLPQPVQFAGLIAAALLLLLFSAYGEGYGVIDLIYANF